MEIPKKTLIPLLIIMALVMIVNTFVVFRMYQQQASWREVAEQDYHMIVQELETEQTRLTSEFMEKIAALETQLTGHEQVLSDTGQTLEQLTEENELLKKKLR